MPSPKDTPIFNLKAVIRETGLKPDTLRAWERRYSLPRPHRSEGGHRLYSQNDVDMLKWLIARQAEGMSIRLAVELWHNLGSEGHGPLVSASGPQSIAAPEGSTITDFRQAWIDACLAFDEQTADQTVTQAFALYPVEIVFFEVLQHGLSQIGELWYEGTADVQQEHFASTLALRRLQALIAATSAPTRSERILIACPPDEEHTFSALLLTLLLRRRGWDVLYLGANVPIDRLEATVSSVRPRLAVMAAQTLPTAATLLDMAFQLQRSGTQVSFGGLIFNRVLGLHTHIPGHFLGQCLDTAPQVVEQLITSPTSKDQVVPVNDRAIQALAAYLDRQIWIDMHVLEAFKTTPMPVEYIRAANSFVGRYITAALKLGNMAYLNDDIVWVNTYLHRMGLNGEKLRHYLATYLRVAQAQLGEKHLLISWLDETIAEYGAET